MSRRRAPIPFVKWKLNIPVDVAATIEELYFNPTLGKPKYGAKSELVTVLLRRFIETEIYGENSSEGSAI